MKAYNTWTKNMWDVNRVVRNYNKELTGWKIQQLKNVSGRLRVRQGKQDKQRSINVKLRRVPATTVAVEKQ
jgi:hypothetical protein